MLDSDEFELISFLVAAGFVCRRKCYEIEAGSDMYLGGAGNTELHTSFRGDPDYEICARIMYVHYFKIHCNVNPWTADYDAFYWRLPDCVIYSNVNGEIISVAFVEANEIAYVCSSDLAEFDSFAQSLVTEMLTKFQVLSFECDDCDCVAMNLRSFFSNSDDHSFDTYVYSGSDSFESAAFDELKKVKKERK